MPGPGTSVYQVSDGDELMDDLIVSGRHREDSFLITGCSYYLGDEFKGLHNRPRQAAGLVCRGGDCSSDGEHKAQACFALCFRIAREVKGVAEPMHPNSMQPCPTRAQTHHGDLSSGLQQDYVSEGSLQASRKRHAAWNTSARIAIVDERSEIAAC